MGERELLIVENLTLARTTTSGETPLVDNVSFSLETERVMGLIGESGSGKSLTCLAIMGLLPFSVRMTAGTIRLDGMTLADLPDKRMRALRGKTMAMVLQNPMSCLDAVFTIRHHFTETLSAHETLKRKERERRALAALTEVGFENPGDILDLYPFQMSGGMLQRVMVALALVARAKLLIADEPTTDLDVVSQTRILDLLERIHRTHGMSILLVTHDLGVIARLSDEVAVMENGRIVDYGETQSLFTDHRTTGYTGALMEAHYSLYGNERNV